MTREEEIRKASLEHKRIVVNSNIYTDNADSFEEGVEWADKNPKSPWISVEDDLPCNHEELISIYDKRNTFYVITLVHSFVVLSRMEKFEDEWHWTTDEPSHWFAIPELPKELEIKL